MATLDELEIARQNIKAELDCIDEKIRDEKLKLMKEWYGVEEGSVVVHGGKDFVVSCILTSFVSRRLKPWVYGHTTKKDGSLSKKDTPLYGDWELKK